MGPKQPGNRINKRGKENKGVGLRQEVVRLKPRQEKYVRIVHEVDLGKQIPGRENSFCKSPEEHDHGWV